MNRKQQLQKAFQRGALLTRKNPQFRDWFAWYILEETNEDSNKGGDITSDAVIKKDQIIKAKITTREPGILAGIEEVTVLLKVNSINVLKAKKDGAKIKKGDLLLEIQGYQKDLLRAERSALDILQRMSGIATLTNKVIKSIKSKVPVSPTRKTHWRYLDKKAVYLGGGLTHRLALWESILIKDNHIAALKREGVKDPIKISLQRAAKEQKKAVFLEIETQKKQDAIHAAQVIKELNLKIPAFIMLDNMSPIRIKDTIKEIKKQKLYHHVLFEASGGISPSKVKEYAQTNVDVISMGCLTHFSPALDIKLRMQ